MAERALSAREAEQHRMDLVRGDQRDQSVIERIRGTNPPGVGVVTAGSIGLGNVNNTSDANKPVSTAQATANTADRARANHTGAQTKATISDLEVLASGTYTPTGTIVANITTLTPGLAHYMRMGNEVHVFGVGTLIPTAAAGTTTTFRLSLPVASNFAANDNLSGVGTFAGSYTPMGALGNVASDVAQFSFPSTTTVVGSFYYSFMYTVI